MRTVAAQTSVASVNTTVENSVTVSPVKLSLGSALQVSGTVTQGGKPVQNALVALHMGDLKLAEATTNANGDYSFNVPIGMSYFQAAFWRGATVYTVVEPQNASSISTPSAVATVSVDLLPLYLIIVVIAGAILVGLYLYVRRMRGKSRASPAAKEMAKGNATPPLSEASTLKQGHAVADASLQGDKTAEEPPQEALEPALSAKGAEPPVDETPHETATQLPESEQPQGADTGVLKQALEFFEQGNDRQGVNMLYDAAIIGLATTHDVTIASHTTYWEKYRAIEAVVPEIKQPLRTLTGIYELANYAGKALTEDQRNAAIDAFRTIKAYLESANTNDPSRAAFSHDFWIISIALYKL
ncbi:MAG: DUF4129 domain-containing protein [Halobacteriota archaeon]